MNLETLEFGMWDVIGIIAGGLAYFMLGALWYMSLFSKQWTAATGRSPDEFKNGGPGATMLVTLGGCLVTTAVLALVYQWAAGESIWDGLVVGAILGVGVAAMEGMKTAVYNFDERARPWALYAINASYAACGITLAGVVYALIV